MLFLQSIQVQFPETACWLATSITSNLHDLKPPFDLWSHTHVAPLSSLSFSFFFFFIISFNLYFWDKVSCSPGQVSNWLDKQGWPGPNFWLSCLHLLSVGAPDLYLLCLKMSSHSSHSLVSGFFLWWQQESEGIRMRSLPSPLFTLEPPQPYSLCSIIPSPPTSCSFLCSSSGTSSSQI